MDEKNLKPQVDTAGAAGTPAAEKDAVKLSARELQTLKADLRKAILELSEEECAVIVAFFS